ncbi:MAG: hypothetical protein QM758_08160 [Armatimonas sp.]
MYNLSRILKLNKNALHFMCPSDAFEAIHTMYKDINDGGLDIIYEKDMSMEELGYFNNLTHILEKEYMHENTVMNFNNNEDIYEIKLIDFIENFEDIFVPGGDDIYLNLINSDLYLIITHEELVRIFKKPC